jgi:diaminopimelate decarboxylase
MGSNYNSRPLAPEALVHGRRAALVRERQPLEKIWEAERLPDWLK